MKIEVMVSATKERHKGLNTKYTLTKNLILQLEDSGKKRGQTPIEPLCWDRHTKYPD